MKWLDSISRPSIWAKVEDIDDAEVWEVKQVLKARTLRFAGGWPRICVCSRPR